MSFLNRKKVRRILRKTLAVFMLSIFISSGLPFDFIFKKIADSRVVDQLYLSKYSSGIDKIVDNYGIKTAYAAAPVVQTRSTGRTTTTNTTSHSITMPSGITTGDLLLLIFSSDGNVNADISNNGWVKLTEARNGTAVTGAVFYKFAEGSDTATVTTSASEQSSHVVLRISGAGIPLAQSANGSSTNSNPPALDTGTSREHLWIATRSGDSTTVATAAPTNFGNLQTMAAAGTGGASTNTAERTITTNTQDPGTFTNNTAPWVSFTIAVPPAGEVPGVSSVGAATAAAGSATSLSVPYPANIEAGDLLVMSIANKHPNNAPSTPSGWTAGASNQASGGQGSSGADAGAAYSTIFTRVADGTETGNVSVTITSGNSSVARITSYRASTGKVWDDPVFASGSDGTAATSWSVTAGSNPGITAGDIIHVASAVNSDAYHYHSYTMTATGATFLATSYPELFESHATTGNDVELVGGRFYVTAGTASAAPVYSMTAVGTATANAPTGPTLFMRIREINPAVPTVTTEAETSVTTSGATLNGSISVTGGILISTRGFAHSTNSTLSTGVSTTTENGTFGAENFDEDISGLTCGTTYYYRAYATNTTGTGYGSIEELTTSACPAPTTTLYSTGGSEQVAFNNIRQNSVTPVFRASALYGAGNFNRFQVELNASSDFSGTAYTETFSSTYSSETQYDLQTTGSLGLPTTNGVTYYVRARASGDGGSNWGDWTSGTWTYTYKSASEDPDWFQTTDAQFNTNTLTDAETNGSGGVVIVDTAGSSDWVVVASDNFNRANGAIGANWDTDDLVVSSNQVFCPENDDNFCFGSWTGGGITSNDVYSELQYVGVSAAVELLGSGGGKDGSYFVSCNFESCTFALWNNTDQLIEEEFGTFSISEGDYIRVAAVGTQITAYVNGVLQDTATNSFLTTRSPVVTFNANGIGDNWSAAEWTEVAAGYEDFATTTSTAINFDSFEGASGWDTASISGVTTDGTIAIQVLDSSQNAINGYSCNVSGGSCNIDLSGLDPVGTPAHATIYLRAVLANTSGTPILQDWSVKASFGSTVSGVAYASNRSTPLTSKDIRLAINGADYGSTVTSDASTGAYSFADLSLEAGDILTLYIEDETEDGVTVTVTDGGNTSDFNVYQDHLAITCHNSCTLTNTDLSNATVTSETDISSIYSVAEGALTVASGKTLLVPADQTFAPGGNLVLGGNLTLLSTGIFTKYASGNITFNGGTNQTVTDSNSSKQDLGAVNITSNSTLKLGSGVKITSVTIDSGSTLDSNGSNVLSLSGDFTNNGTFTPSTGTVGLEGVGTSVISGSSDISFNNLNSYEPGKTVKFQAGKVFTISGTMDFDGSSGNPIYIESTVPDTQWRVNFSSEQSSLTYISVKDAGCAESSQLAELGSGMVSGGNTGICWFRVAIEVTQLIFGRGSTRIFSGGGDEVTGGGDSGGGGPTEEEGDGGSGGGEGQGGSEGGGGGGGATP